MELGALADRHDGAEHRRSAAPAQVIRTRACSSSGGPTLSAMHPSLRSPLRAFHRPRRWDRYRREQRRKLDAQPLDQRPRSRNHGGSCCPCQSGGRRRSLPAEDADDCPPVPRPELHEIAVLVHVPQPIVCIGENPPTVQQTIDGRTVRDLAGHCLSVTQDPDRHPRCSMRHTPPRRHLSRRHPGSPVDRQPSHVQLELGVAPTGPELLRQTPGRRRTLQYPSSMSTRSARIV